MPFSSTKGYPGKVVVKGGMLCIDWKPRHLNEGPGFSRGLKPCQAAFDPHSPYSSLPIFCTTTGSGRAEINSHSERFCRNSTQTNCVMSLKLIGSTLCKSDRPRKLSACCIVYLPDGAGWPCSLGQIGLLPLEPYLSKGIEITKCFMK